MSSTSSMDPYVVLGVEPGVGPAEIDAAYAAPPASPRPRRPGHRRRAANAARRYRSELGDAYRSLLGTAPPTVSSASAAPGTNGAAAGARSTGGAGTSAARKLSDPSPGRDWLVVLGAVVLAWVVLQVPVALGFGVGGIVVGWIAAIGVIVVALVKVRARRR